MSAQQQQEETQMSFYPVISGNIRKPLHTYVRIITVFYLGIKIQHLVINVNKENEFFIAKATQKGWLL